MAGEQASTDTVVTPAPETGRRLAHFEIIATLGSGGMGCVYRARDLTLQRTVALKTLHAQHGADQQQLLAEARAASALNHPGIVTIFEVGTAEGTDFIAMELVEGESLATRLRQGPVPADQSLSWAIELAEALAAAHRRGIIHRDLKPDNVMLNEDRRLKILDFGIAKRVAGDGATQGISDSTLTAGGLIVGTPAYMSPEQASGRPIDARSDLFSLGALLYEMLTGVRPFSGSTPIELASAILHQQATPPSQQRPGLDPAWNPLLARLLAKRPDDRYSSAEQLLQDLHALAASRARPASDRSRRALVFALLALAVLAPLAWWLATQQAHDPAPINAVAGDGFPDFHFRLLSRGTSSQSAPSLSPDASTVAFVARDEAGVGQIWVTNVNGGDPLQITHGSADASTPQWTARGDRIVFARRGLGIWDVPTLGGDARQLATTGFAPNLSPDGRQLLFVADRQPWIVELDGGKPRPLPGFTQSFFGALARPVFSPDGEQIVTFWPHDRRPLGELWIAPSDASAAPRALTDLQFTSNGTAPVWSGDGNWILFSSDHGGSTNLWRIPAAGGEPRAVTRGAGSDLSLDLSRDNRRLVYTTTRRVARLEMLDAASGERRSVFERREMILRPEISPDGQYAVYFGRVPHAFQLLLVELATGREQQLTHGLGEINSQPRWAPDGQSVYFYQEAPTVSLRKQAIAGGKDVLIADGFSWPEQNAAALAPDEAHLVYTLRDGNRPLASRIRTLASGEEWSLPMPLFACRWSADGQTIWGNTAHPEQIYRCALHGACEPVTAGEEAHPASDGKSLHFFRDDDLSIWRRDLVTGSEQQVVKLDNYDGLSFNWGVTPAGDIVYHEQDPGHPELWLGDAVD